MDRGVVVPEFQTMSKGRVHVHILQTNQFRTRHVSVKLARPLDRQYVTATALVPYLWMEGTRALPTAKQIMRYTDDLFGTVLRTGISRRGNAHVAEVIASVPEEQGIPGAAGLFDKVVDLVRDVVFDPLHDDGGFQADHVERERSLHRKRIESIYDDKIAYAAERCMAETCHGERAGLPRLGFLDDVEGLTRGDLWSAYQALLSDADVHVYLVGQIADVKETAERVLHMMTSNLPSTRTDSPLNAPATAMPKRGAHVHTVREPQAVAQGKLNLGFRTGVSYGDDAFYQLMVCNGVLGSFPHSKLFVNVREKASLAYYASSRLDGLTGLAMIQTGIEVQNYDQALEIILQQVKDMQQGAVTDEELAFTKHGLRNQYLQLLDQPMSMADVHLNGILAGVKREVPDILKQIEQVTKEDVVSMAAQYELDTVYFLTSEAVDKDA